MIELYLKQNKVIKVKSVDEINYELKDLFNIRIIDYTDKELNELSEKFKIDVSIFNLKKDIELSSNYQKLADQLSFNFSIPSYSSAISFNEEEVFILIKDTVVFYFLSSNIDQNLIQLTKFRYDFDSLNFKSHLEHFAFQIGIITDYYADLTELISNKIKFLYQKILKPKQFIDFDLDLITELNFNNLLIKESITKFQRILNLLVRSNSQEDIVNDKLYDELEDIIVISEHIQYNFDRLDNLKANINSKIDLELNRIFKTLTIITVCISIPSLIAGIYGMNFKNMPELNWNYGYPISIALMLISFITAVFYFKYKKWLK